MEGHGVNPAQNRAPLRAKWGSWDDPPTQDMPGERGSWGEAGAEYIGSFQPQLGGENSLNPKSLGCLQERKKQSLGHGWRCFLHHVQKMMGWLR